MKNQEKPDDRLHSATPTKWFAKIDPSKNATCAWPRSTATTATSAKRAWTKT